MPKLTEAESKDLHRRVRETMESQDLLKVAAAKVVSEEVGIHFQTILKYYNKHEKLFDNRDELTRSVSELIDEVKILKDRVNSPFILTPQTIPEVELSQEVTTEVFISDLHLHPEHDQGHDPAAWELTKRIVRDIKPDIVFWGGDIIDCYAPSRYEKKPRLATPEAWEGEVSFATQELTNFFRTLPESTRHIWLTGNHELRLPRSVHSNAPWLISRIKSVEDELGLKKLNVQIVDDGYKIGKLAHFHGHNISGAGRVNVAKNKFDRLNMNMIFGHHHRFSEWIPRDFDRSYRGAWSNGCLHWLTAEYAEYPEWHLGFSVIEYAKSGMFDVQKVLMHKPSVRSGKVETIHYGKHYKLDMGF